MKKLLVILSVVAFAVATMGQDGCATEESDGPTVKQEPGKKKAKRKKAKQPAKPARVGDTITLTGFDGEKVAVKLLRVEDPVQAGEYDTAPAGGRYVGVELEIENVGRKVYSDSPSNGMVLILAGDRQADTTILSGGPCSGGFASSLRIAPGGRRRGCVPFEVPGSRRAKTLQFTMNSGFGDESAEWRLR